MARARSIGSWLYLDDRIAGLSDAHQLLIAYLPCIADREGRLEDRPMRIGAELFPYRRTVKVSKMLDDLAAIGKLVRYNVDGKPYIQLADWQHQHPNVKERASAIPPQKHGAEHHAEHHAGHRERHDAEHQTSTPVVDLPLSVNGAAVNRLPATDQGNPSQKEHQFKGKDGWSATPESKAAAREQFGITRRIGESDAELDDRTQVAIDKHKQASERENAERRRQIEASKAKASS